MGYRLESKEPLSIGLRRIATEQIDQALEQLAAEPIEDIDEAIHDARKRFKKIRAILRLVRDEIGEDIYKRENVCYRDAGRQLADLRDSYVKIKTLDKLTDRFSQHLNSDDFTQLREKLIERYDTVRQRILKGNATAEVAASIQQARLRVDDWPIKQEDFSALFDGLKRVYKRGSRGLKKSYKDPSPERFHEWRKRVKYLWYHTRILGPLWPGLFGKLAGELHELANYLGDNHDLAELEQATLNQPKILNESQQTRLVSLIKQQRDELLRFAKPVGERIYVEKPDAFARRVAGYWDAWQTEQYQPAVQIKWPL